MAEKRYLQVLITWKDPIRAVANHPLAHAVIEKNALDWLRFNNGTWVIWTDKTSTDWYLLLLKQITKDDGLVIYRVDFSDRYGWADDWVWKWIDRHRS